MIDCLRGGLAMKKVTYENGFTEIFLETEEEVTQSMLASSDVKCFPAANYRSRLKREQEEQQQPLPPGAAPGSS